MDLQELRLLQHLAGSLHFGRTAAEMNKSPSALSRIIQRMEDELATPLFERDHRVVKLTAEGERFAVFARDTLASFEHFKQSVLAEKTPIRGTIGIFASVTACQSFLPPMLAHFRARHPGIELKLHSGHAVDALEQLDEAEIDITVAALPPHRPAHVAIHVILTTALVFVAPLAPCDVSWAVDRHPRDLGNVDLILPAQGLARQALERWFRSQQLTPRRYTEVMGNEAILALVSTGAGVGVVPDIVFHESPLRKFAGIIDVAPALGALDVGFCALRRSLRKPVVAAFWNAVTQPECVPAVGSTAITPPRRA